jgi:hypothetical protein
MTRAAAAKASQAADALLAWLRDQPPPVFSARRAPSGHGPDGPEAGVTDAPPGAAEAGQGAGQTGADRAVDPKRVAAEPEPPAPVGDALESASCQAPAPESAPGTALGTGAKEIGGAPLRLAHTDWLYHRLSVAGPDDAVAAFQAAAAGAGVIPWHLDLDRIEEDCFHVLVAPPAPQQRSLSLAGARIVAGQLRDAVARRHELAVARVGRSRACRFDLHALVPVPGEILLRGPDDQLSLAWLWQHWGTTQGLRHVAAAPETGQDRGEAGETVFATSFWSADWSPWRALAQIAARWPALRFDLRPSYDAP